MNTIKLKQKMKEIGITQTAIAKQMGIKVQSLNRKIKAGKFSISEAVAIKNALRLTNDEFIDIFMQ